MAARDENYRFRCNPFKGYMGEKVHAEAVFTSLRPLPEAILKESDDVFRFTDATRVCSNCYKKMKICGPFKECNRSVEPEPGPSIPRVGRGRASKSSSESSSASSGASSGNVEEFSAMDPDGSKRMLKEKANVSLAALEISPVKTRKFLIV